MSIQPIHPLQPPRLPWPLLACALVALAALYFSGEHFIGVPVLGGLLIATYATRWRLPEGAWLRWGLRTLIFVAICMSVGLPTEDAAAWYFEPQYTNLLGYLLAGEMVVRAWRRADSSRKPRGIFLLLSAIIMAAASNTYQRLPMQVLTPLYTLLAALSLRSLDAAKPPGPHRPARLRGLLALRAAVLGIALLVGFVSVSIVTKYEGRITAWAVEMLRTSRPLAASSIGLSGSPQLSRVFNPQPSMTRVLLIEGATAERHLRVTAFDTYAHTQWHPSLQERPYAPVGPRVCSAGGDGQRLRLTRLADLPLLLAVPSGATAVEAPGALERDELGALRDREWTTRFSYDAFVPAQAGDQRVPLCPPPTTAQRVKLLQVPAEIDVKVSDLARQVAGDGDAPARLLRIANHLRSTHRYSLVFDPRGEPLTDFILNGRAAHCQYFASAMVIMARAAGVPARLAVGFYAHEVYGDGRTVVRDRDAHAWAECWIDGRGWVTADATPAGGLPDGLFAPPSQWQRFWERVKDTPGVLRQWLAAQPRAILILVIAAAAGLVLSTLAARVIRRRREQKGDRSGEYAQPNAELAAAARRFDRWLRECNIPCAPHRTWREHLSSLSGANPPLPDAAACIGFVDAYDRARFGKGCDDALPRLREMLEKLDRSQAVPL